MGLRARLLVVVAALVGSMSDARADGGQVQYSGQAGPYTVTVFTQPVPLRVGWTDFSMLVQDSRTGDVVLDDSLMLELTALATPAEAISAAPSRAGATNKLLRAASVYLPAAGKYRGTVTVDGRADVARAEFECEVAPALPQWRSLLPWMLWPVAPIALYAWHTLAEARHGNRRPVAGPA